MSQKVPVIMIKIGDNPDLYNIRPNYGADELIFRRAVELLRFDLDDLENLSIGDADRTVDIITRKIRSLEEERRKKWHG